MKGLGNWGGAFLLILASSVGSYFMALAAINSQASSAKASLAKTALPAGSPKPNLLTASFPKAVPITVASPKPSLPAVSAKPIPPTPTQKSANSVSLPEGRMVQVAISSDCRRVVGGSYDLLRHDDELAPKIGTVRNGQRVRLLSNNSSRGTDGNYYYEVEFPYNSTNPRVGFILDEADFSGDSMFELCRSGSRNGNSSQVASDSSCYWRDVSYYDQLDTAYYDDWLDVDYGGRNRYCCCNGRYRSGRDRYRNNNRDYYSGRYYPNRYNQYSDAIPGAW